MKGVILHGGAGTRLRPLTYAGPKQLIPVANKPVSQYALEDLISCGVKEVAIILGETFPDIVREYYGDGSRFGVEITYIYQGKPLGIAHAVSLCRDFVDDDEFIVYLGDNIFQNGVARYVERYRRDKPDAYILLKEVEDPTRYGVAELDDNGRLIRLVEKPKTPPSNLVITGVYIFSSAIFDVIKDLRPSWRGELEITDAIQGLLDRGYRVGFSIVEGWWVDTGKSEDILSVNARILDERITTTNEGLVKDSRIDGRVCIGARTIIKNSVVRGPSIIGKDCNIENSYVGPYTSIGDGCMIKNASIEYSIVMDRACLEGVNRLGECLIGRNASVKKNSMNTGWIKLQVSDHSIIEI